MSLLPDKPHQIVRASAGTGKTYQLTNRYLQMVQHGALPQSILATTFTRKAANEIMQRVIQNAAREALADPQKTVYLKALTSNLHRLMISTLDSLFQKMGRCFAMELQLPNNAQVFEVTDFAMQKLQMQAIDHVLMDNEPFVLLDLFRRLYHSDAGGAGKVISVLQSIVNDLYDIYKMAPDESQWINYQITGLMDDDAVKQLVEIFNNLEDELPKTKAGKTVANALKAWQTSVALIANEQWKTFLTKDGIAKKRQADETIYSRAELSETVIRVYDLLIQHARACMLQEQRDLNHARYTIARQYAQLFDQLRLDARALLHSDIPQRLESAFENPDDEFLVDLAYRMDQKIEHMMLDEFQDTSLQQWNILRAQAMEIRSHDDGFGSRRFFCVGDIKQAIYGWRGGGAEIFNHIGEEMALSADPADHEIVSMDQSWRSSQIVLDVVNTTFNSLEHNPGINNDDLLSWANQWQKGFGDHEAAQDHPGYVLFQATGSEDIADTDEVLELDDEPAIDLHTVEVCHAIAQLHKQSPHASIGVLVWTNAQVQEYMTRLRAMHIDVASEGGVYLHDDPAVSCILAAMVMADRPDHAASAFELLNSPLGKYLGMTGYHPGDVRSLAMTIRQQLAGMGYPRLVGHWANLLAKHSDARGSERLTLLIQLAVNFETSQSASLKPAEFAQYVQSKQVPISQQSPVQVMTVHKSKGLEFDAVFLPVLKRKLGYMQQNMCYVSRPQMTAPVEYVYASTTKELRAMYPPLEEAYAQEHQRRFTDDLCAMYVAMTRAKHALYLYAQPLKENKNGSLSTTGNSDSSLAAILRHALLEPDNIRVDHGQVLFEYGQPAWHQQISQTADDKPQQVAITPHKTCTINIKNKAGQRSLQRIAPSQLEGSGSVNVADLLAMTKTSGQSRGTVIHRLFEEIAWLGNDTPLPDQQTLIDLLDSEKLEHEPEFTDSFVKMLQMPAVIDALKQPSDWDDATCQLWREKRFAVLMDGRLVQGMLDRVHVWQDRAVILDYKTDAPGETGYDGLVDYYRPQIQAYRKALAAMLKVTPEHIGAQLIFVRDGVVKNV
ncbi:MAG TPA: hypothetical protein DER01_11005 [Phycisphaerales bacterium]|nr:hypothetical protein [Phycisphaerales bacterium]